MKHLKYLRYIIRHKWFVFLACRRCGVGLWQSIIHDWHKFLPSEWFAYVENFYGDYPSWNAVDKWTWPFKQTKDYWSHQFDLAWNHHQKRGKHHWQYWVLTNDSSEPKHQALDMPEKYAREMVADWWGAGMAITGKWDAKTWYHKNKEQIILTPFTRGFVECILDKSESEFSTPESIANRIRILGY